MDVLVVESPAKAKTIGKYLGPGYTVLASYGHVRDLPPKDGSVRPDEDFAMDWEVDPQSQKRLDAIAKAITKGGKLYLATDPDREGEAISWHVRDVLKRKKALEGVDVKRVTFNAITKQSVLDAVAHPRELDQDLIDAYMARRALDYLVGFTLSPVLWRKLPGSRSAGRVQSVALRLICEREAEIEVFKSREYWTVDVLFGTNKKQTLKARLTHLDGRKLDKFDLDTQERAAQAKREIERRAFSVASIDRRQVRLDSPLKSLGIHSVRVALHPEVVVHVSVNVARSSEEAELQANPELASAVAESEREAARLEREAEEAEQAAEAPRLVLPE